jgi:hypothetical protein
MSDEASGLLASGRATSQIPNSGCDEKMFSDLSIGRAFVRRHNEASEFMSPQRTGRGTTSNKEEHNAIHGDGQSQ